ncbi:LiaI-LiaF-like domain-containing protein [Telluribacter sp. SYSU D00476]|uniref:LiaI-LiaF-like domain-containing protein n=1 Tax=Telluribacter sp. SYSU D00476 TaxID=2811430 RepID=UPI001FF1138F|nr:DUF5668 domain-containing protein [Telluribacter sp. SYSU D00476]
MRRSNGIIWGGLLVVLGVFWLLRNMGLLDLDWEGVLRYWPALLILAGISLLVSGRERSGVGSGLAGLLIALAVLGGILYRTDRAFDRHRNNWDFRWDHDDNNDHDSSDQDYEEDRRSRPTRTQTNHYEYEMDAAIQEATFNLEGGAGEFKLIGTTAKLFEADTRSSLGGFISNIRSNKTDGTATVEFKMEQEQINIKDGKVKNVVTMSLNEAPVWNVDIGIGAGKADIDLSNYKVKTLKVSTGVADVDVRLGEKADTDVKIESGVASVTLEVPKAAGCEVRIDGAMNIRNLDDLQKVEDNLYRSPNFDTATRKITIKYDAGLSKVRINRY